MPSTHRRRFINGLVGLGFASWRCGPSTPSSGQASTHAYWVSAHGSSPPHRGMVLVARPPGTVTEVSTDFRGHGLAQRPNHPGSVVLFGRRPGHLALEVDVRTSRARAQLSVPAHRRLQGHGCYDKEGTRLFTTEADVRSGAGYIGVWDADTLQREGEFATGGIGPHEVKLHPDGQTLVVCNGGILTRPETGRQKLNLETMAPSLTYIELDSGRIAESHVLPEPKASIRHLDVARDGTVVFGQQVQREALNHDEIISLGAIHRRGEPLQVLRGPIPVVARMRDYVGSVAVSDLTRRAAFSSPRGNLVLFFEIDTGEFAGFYELADVSGLGVSEDGAQFVLSSSLGHVRVLEARTLEEVRSERRTFSGIRWDNHMIVTRMTS